MSSQLTLNIGRLFGHVRAAGIDLGPKAMAVKITRNVHNDGSNKFDASNTSVARYEDAKTHTHQQFDEGDFRLARFLNRTKEVNPRFAIDLIAEAPPIPIKARSTFCDGGDGPLGHPRVFINLDQPGNHACGYCGLRFYQDQSGHHH